MGRMSLPSRLPQYLITAMLVGEEMVTQTRSSGGASLDIARGGRAMRRGVPRKLAGADSRS